MTDTGGIVVERDLMCPRATGWCWRPMSTGRPGRGRFRCSSNARSTTNRRRAEPSAPLRSRHGRGPRSPLISSGTAMPSPIRIAAARYRSGAHFTKYLSEAEDGCDALGWLQRQALVQPPCRHLRAVLCGPHAGRARLPRPAGTDGAVPRLRRLLQHLSQRHPPRRRVRPETGDMGLSQRARRCPRPSSESRPSGAGHLRLVPPDALA